MSAAKNVLSILSETNGYVALAIQVGETVVPLVKGLISEIRKIGGGTETVSYQILITADVAELEDVKKLSTDDLTAINEEFKRLGLPTVVIPESPASPAGPASPAPSADPAKP